jgi:hypothetical protein
VVRHRSEEDRASCYDELQAAEEAARAAKRGLFSGKEPAATKKPQDLSADSARAKAHFPFLQRARTLRGVVDYVFAGAVGSGRNGCGLGGLRGSRSRGGTAWRPGQRQRCGVSQQRSLFSPSFLQRVSLAPSASLASPSPLSRRRPRQGDGAG